MSTDSYASTTITKVSKVSNQWMQTVEKYYEEELLHKGQDSMDANRREIFIRNSGISSYDPKMVFILKSKY